MKKHVLATVLWSVTGWCIGAMVGWALDLGPALAPIIAVASAILIATDPRRLLWSRPSAEPRLISEHAAA